MHPLLKKILDPPLCNTSLVSEGGSFGGGKLVPILCTNFSTILQLCQAICFSYQQVYLILNLAILLFLGSFERCRWFFTKQSLSKVEKTEEGITVKSLYRGHGGGP